ncbi:hypothetical protein A3B42_01235 [Candidatus Daviesbacteria bacterium RIFCSPLOWO2_01_FULL_38_10]|nr:MAG: hypothetical protein A3D02_04775 [Candidatus Daviesbacteria bacterium RIFCSPHIGHO2_02_FULL_39_41]OGE27449.1 MAG: hypothetical protein A2772_01695 [Candidatus Daviesbacteria bacterium RIFCSPHIGHO2_01_FULL_38_8b]OGE37161.1 MAG: hypothetical protein A3B42_01235 [Candidatus Daviesbacteria bacterium RIFCSPLOWO2_01_FULL_38_10]OGE45308.1 MAG: hypothetical protein A3E67_02980 [Candidatus Daviesbacteria bacterium RIFCSPHIGHO2_12_FULL_38_25]OGE68787.1 MAG: hypothetical protein A3H81_00715 [Candid
MKSILKQTSWLFGAQALGRIIGFFYTIYLARSLGVEDFGLYSVALAYYSLFAAFADFGFSRFLIREIAKGSIKIAEVFSNISILRLTITSLLFAVFSLVLYIFDPDKFRVGLSLLAILTVLPASVAQTADSIFIAVQKMKLSALSLVVLNVATTLAGIFLLNSGFGTTGAVVALIVGQVAYLVVTLALLKFQKMALLSFIKTKVLIKVIKGALPYGLLAILGLIYFRIDTLLLSYMRGNFETGIYSAGYKFLEALVFIPSSLAIVLFPTLAKLHDHDLTKIKLLFSQSVKTMVFLSALVFLAYNLILPPLIRFFLPSYLPAIEVIRILSLTVPFMFIYVPASQILLSTDKYLKQVILISLLPLLFNIILNLIFIPRFGFLAASWITVASDILSTALIIFFIRKFIFKR